MLCERLQTLEDDMHAEQGRTSPANIILGGPPSTQTVPRELALMGCSSGVFECRIEQEKH